MVTQEPAYGSSRNNLVSFCFCRILYVPALEQPLSVGGKSPQSGKLTGFFESIATTVMTILKSFAAIASADARVLILGSMPSETSLLKQQYYGHPRNAFWPIMGVLFAAGPELPYEQRKQILMQRGIAVWDVLKHCRRPGSMDADIDMASIEVNPFAAFFARHPLLRWVCFNGGTAEKVYRQRVMPDLSGKFEYLHYQRLPSTSPAYAAMNLQQKVAVWAVVRKAAAGMLK